MADIKSTLPTTDSADGTDGSAAPSLALQVAGKDGSGNLQTLLTDTNGVLEASDVVNAGGATGVITSISTTPIAIKVGASNLANRKRLAFINVGTATLYWGMTNAITGSANAMPLFRNQPVADSWGPNTTVWIVCPSGTGSLSVNEGA